MRSPSERCGREGLKTKPRDYEEICERLFAPSPASEKQIEKLPFSYWKARRGTALGLSSLISSKLLKKILMYSWMEEQSPAEKIKIFLEKNYEKYWKLRNRFLDFKFFWGGMPPSLQTALAVRALDDRRSCFVPGSVRTVILCRQGLSNVEGAWKKVKGTWDKM